MDRWPSVAEGVRFGSHHVGVAPLPPQGLRPLELLAVPPPAGDAVGGDPEPVDSPPLLSTAPGVETVKTCCRG